MGVAFVLLAKPAGTRLIKDPLLIWGMVFFIFVSLLAARAINDFADYRIMIANRAVLYGSVFLLIFLAAFWLHQAEGQWDLLFIALLTGFLAQIIRKGDWTNFIEVAPLYWTGVKRASFGFPVNRFGLWSAVILLVCALLYRRFWGCSASKLWYGIRIAFWIFMCAVSTMGIVFSQSRAVWLASTLVIPPVLWGRFRQTKQLKRRTIGLLAVAAIGLAGLTNLPAILTQRMFSDSDIEAYKAVVEGTFDSEAENVSNNVKAIYERVRLYQFFYENWKRRPLLGYGPAASEILLQNASGPYESFSRYDHVHNIVFDVLLRLGAIGFILYAGGFLITIRQLVRGKRRGEVELDYYFVAIGGLGLIAICAMSAQPLNVTKGLYAVGLLGGIGYASRFKHVINASISDVGRSGTPRISSTA